MTSTGELKRDYLNDADMVVLNAYVKNGRNQSEAYRTAYPKSSVKSSNSNAARFFKRPAVAEYVAALDAQVQQDTGESAERISRDLRALHDRCLSEGIPVFFEGNECGSRPDYATAKGCLELLGKSNPVGMFTEKVQHSTDPLNPPKIVVVLKK